jgi:glucose-1-phosphate thymidylyltransferase
MGSGRKGIVLAAGKSSRLYPVTKAFSKQLLPIYDKPMVFYPIATLMTAGIREILVITTEQDSQLFFTLLQDGNQWGINIAYAIQENPNGIAEAFLIAKHFIGESPCCLILGDNIFYGHDLSSYLKRATARTEGATVFGYRVLDPERYGVVEFDQEGNVIGLQEKPRQPKSNYALTGLYFYDKAVVHYAKELKYSDRGELEITDLNRIYLDRQALSVELLGRGFAWLDTGTVESLLQATQFIGSLESRQGWKICVPEEVAYRQGYINKEQLLKLAREIPNSSYGSYLASLTESDNQFSSNQTVTSL